MMSEKQQQQDLPLAAGAGVPASPRRSSHRIFVVVVVVPFLAYLVFCPHLTCLSLAKLAGHRSKGTVSRCPAQPELLQMGAAWNPLDDEEFTKLTVGRLSKSVTLRTESFDNEPMDASDPFFNKFADFSAWLENEFPSLFKEPIKHEYINHHGHLFTWEGSNKKLKPVILMAHIDTVPVPEQTFDQWKFPPFEGKVAVNATSDTPGAYVWGRGASDCKNSLIAIYGVIERLVAEGFQPERTIIVSNGFDEEIGGPRGALPLAEAVEKQYGRDSIALIHDEGFSGVSYAYGAKLVSFGMAEKGAINAKLRVNSLGGHASIPYGHTAIGIIAQLIATLETNPFPTTLEADTPWLKELSCQAEYGTEMPKDLRKKILRPKSWPALAKELGEGPVHARWMPKAHMGTTQAIDLIQGGVKINALPEQVEAAIDSRIGFLSSVKATKEHWVNLLRPAAHALNFTFEAFGHGDERSDFHVSLSDSGGHFFEPAPITSSEDKSFALMGGTAKAVFGEDAIIAPTGMFGTFCVFAHAAAYITANTDTRRFWNLTKNIYRFNPAYNPNDGHQHTVNEVCPVLPVDQPDKVSASVSRDI